jgi:flagellar P-ring protein precursor FlgI
MLRALLVFLALMTGFATTPAAADRVKDLGGFQGIRSNQLTG